MPGIARKISDRSIEGLDDGSINFLKSEIMSAALEGKGYLNTVQVQTVAEGFNSGRTYYLRATTGKNVPEYS